MLKTQVEEICGLILRDGHRMIGRWPYYNVDGSYGCGEAMGREEGGYEIFEYAQYARRVAQPFDKGAICIQCSQGGGPDENRVFRAQRTIKPTTTASCAENAKLA